MESMLVIVPIILLLCVLYKIFKGQRKYLLEMKLVSIYDKIELELIKSKNHLDREDVRFLKVNKNIAQNPEYLDVEVIMAINHIIKEKNIKTDTDWYTKYLDRQSDYLKILLDEYTKTQIDVSLLSALRVKFITKALISKINGFVKNRTFNIHDVVKKKISDALYNDDKLTTLSVC